MSSSGPTRDRGDETAARTRFDFPIKVTAHVCANGETWEYRVWMGESVIGQTWRTPKVGDSHARNAAAALREVMAAA